MPWKIDNSLFSISKRTFEAVKQKISCYQPNLIICSIHLDVYRIVLVVVPAIHRG